jgi:hypothetical protein
MAASAATAEGRIGEAAPRTDVLVWISVGGWAAAILATHLWGRWLQARGYRLWQNAPPLTGHLDPRLPAAALGAAVLGIAGIAFGPRLADRLGWRQLLWATFLAAVAWAVALALVDGPGGLIRSPSSVRDYLYGLPLVGSPGSFLDHFTEHIGGYPTHLRAHPPGMTLLLWAFDRLGLSGPWWVAVLEIAGGASASVAAVIALREVAGEDRARAAAPFLAFAPAAVTVASSGDAFFAGVGAWSVASLVLATGRDGRRADGLSILGGVLFGATIFLSYGLVLLAAIPVTVAIARRQVRLLLVAAAGTAAVVLAFLGAGFWWVDGFLATRVQYLASVARDRPSFYFVLANLAAFAIVLGPAAMAGLARLRDRPVWLLVGGALVAVALADLSGMSKAEVERIWLPFVPWVLVATAALPRPERRAWLTLTVTAGLAFQLLVRMPW